MYVIVDLELVNAARGVREPCEECWQVVKHSMSGEEVGQLECEQCMRGFHLCCLDPPMDSTPEVQHPSWTQLRLSKSSSLHRHHISCTHAAAESQRASRCLCELLC